MRKVLGLAAVAVLVTIGAAACQPVEPAMTITAKPVGKPSCYDSARIEGYVTPIGATHEVVLQRTVNGKWVDWKWYASTEEASYTSTHLLTAQTFEGGYYTVDFLGSVKPSTIHLRVRSKGGTAFSPGVYVSSTCPY